MRDHRKLHAFCLADSLVTTYKATREFPSDERFGLCAQMRRAAVSVAVNIVEGGARPSEREYRHFLVISFGSVRELGYLIEVASRLRYADSMSADYLFSLQGRTAAALAALIRSREA